ncbi:hypothetical protein ACFYPC_09675 [Streptomyces sp. NPDC005808]|uniref:hypothetical protein n=1 Tax=Streptomyces sp. NPDC005808 TaxID=3364734 RepID=UPI0036AD7EE1
MTDDDRTDAEHPALEVARQYRRQREEAARQQPVTPSARPDPTPILQRLRAAVSAGRWPHLVGKLPDTERHEEAQDPNSE